MQRTREQADSGTSSKWPGLKIIWKTYYSVRISPRHRKLHSALALPGMGGVCHDKRMKLKWLCFYKKFVLKHFTRKCKNARFGAKLPKSLFLLCFSVFMQGVFGEILTFQLFSKELKC
jgi:hypothetical protein